MSYAKKAAAAADEIIRKKAGAKGKYGRVVNLLHNDKEIRQMLKHAPKELHRMVCTAAVKEAAKHVETEAAVQIAIVKERRIPYRGKLGDSRKTGTRALWGQKPRKRIGTPAGDDMSDAVTSKLLPYRKSAPSTMIVGTNYFQYNYGHIHEPRVGESSPRHMMWGNDSKTTHMKRPWLAPAAKTTIMRQRQAMIRVIKRRMRRYLK